jgi:hypothetical protein
MPVPGQKVNETFDEAFPDSETAKQYREDSLVLMEPPRVRFAATLMNAVAAMYEPALKQTKPFLVCSDIISMNDLH